MQDCRKYFNIQENGSFGIEMMKETPKFKEEEELQEEKNALPQPKSQRMIKRPRLMLVKTPNQIFKGECSPEMIQIPFKQPQVPLAIGSTRQMANPAQASSHRKTFVSKSDDQEKIRMLKGETRSLRPLTNGNGVLIKEPGSVYLRQATASTLSPAISEKTNESEIERKFNSMRNIQKNSEKNRGFVLKSKNKLEAIVMSPSDKEKRKPRPLVAKNSFFNLDVSEASQGVEVKLSEGSFQTLSPVGSSAIEIGNRKSNRAKFRIKPTQKRNNEVDFSFSSLISIPSIVFWLFRLPGFFQISQCSQLSRESSPLPNHSKSHLKTPHNNKPNFPRHQHRRSLQASLFSQSF